ncbi:NADH ubiquinone oxidoreductase 20 kDa subunit [uncultured spirochete]|jgi:NADH-quinone oxidoreductase subunit B|uniref:NADH ubiquinone oxidoreductase 20 kDa subunit n=1 Tax=uncultured spirochete TaxID=156406 RepID=A0A3P3XJI3_9SPIR|nr:NADH-quinone oxidoreductase subunit NuoB [Rectinema subterraneum]SLM13705.1 NADH ubiquinone oxidoreductase 20 kDa subunit [uncultured spirochete]
MAKELTQKAAWDRVLAKLKKNSLWMLHYCTGCGAIELPPTMTARYDMERFGIMPMVTPRQADILLITGYLSVKTLKRVILVYEQMQAPKYVVGFGSCTINGGMYWDSYSTIKSLDQYLPVEMYLAGCMPRPEAIIKGFSWLIDRVGKGEANSWRDYYENYEFYRKNQEELFGGPIQSYQDIPADAQKFGILEARQ